MPFEPSVQIPFYPDATTPERYEIGLHFLERYEEEGLLGYIQDVRSRAILVRRLSKVQERAQQSFRHEQEYWRCLRGSCARMVEQVRSGGLTFDLIADPPSNTGYHRPYLTALGEVYPDAAYCYCVKDRHLEAGPGEISFAELDKGTQLRHRAADVLHERRSVLIVDDIIANGLTTSVVIHKLRQHVHPEARFTLACPLRLPARNEADELQAMIDAM